MSTTEKPAARKKPNLSVVGKDTLDIGQEIATIMAGSLAPAAPYIRAAELLAGDIALRRDGYAKDCGHIESCIHALQDRLADLRQAEAACNLMLDSLRDVPQLQTVAP